jgi:hypothetical protein
MNFIDPRHPDYHSYLLRLWRNGAQDGWHASLQSTATEQIYHFAEVEALIAFLIAQVAESRNDPPTASSPR